MCYTEVRYGVLVKEWVVLICFDHQRKTLPNNVRGGVGLCVCVGECLKTAL